MSLVDYTPNKAEMQRIYKEYVENGGKITRLRTGVARGHLNIDQLRQVKAREKMENLIEK